MTITSELENTNISDFSVFCKKILSLRREIQSVELINKKGRLIESTAKNNAINLLADKKEMFYMSEILQESMKKEQDGEFGKVNYSCTHREKVVIFSFIVGENMLVVISLVPINSDAIAKEIISLIGQNAVVI